MEVGLIVLSCKVLRKEKCKGYELNGEESFDSNEMNGKKFFVFLNDKKINPKKLNAEESFDHN